MKSYWIYIITSQTGTLYIGVTGNLEVRIQQHKAKIIKGFSRKYNINKLIYFEEFGRVEDAIEAEKRIKGWTRARKIELIKTKNPDLNELFPSADPSLRSG